LICLFGNETKTQENKNVKRDKNKTRKQEARVRTRARKDWTRARLYKARARGSMLRDSNILLGGVKSVQNEQRKPLKSIFESEWLSLSCFFFFFYSNLIEKLQLARKERENK
jgi:hypothetical protein